MKIDKLIVASPQWSLTCADEAEFRLLFKDTKELAVVNLFREPPVSDADYLTKYFPSRLFRIMSKQSTSTIENLRREAKEAQLMCGNITMEEYNDTRTD